MLVFVGRTPSSAAGPLAGLLILRSSSGTRASRADQGVRPTNQCTTPRLGKVSGIGRRHRILQVPLKSAPQLTKLISTLFARRQAKACPTWIVCMGGACFSLPSPCPKGAETSACTTSTYLSQCFPQTISPYKAAHYVSSSSPAAFRRRPPASVPARYTPEPDTHALPAGQD